MSTIRVSLLLLLLSLCFITSLAFADAEATGRTAAKLKSLDAVASLLAKKERRLSELQAAGQEGAKLQQVRRERDRLQANFIEIASGVDLDVFKEQQESKEFDWLREIQSLLDPLIREVQRLTERPRQIDAYRTETEELTERVERLRAAISKVKGLEPHASGVTLQKLGETRTFWEQRLETSSTNLKIAQEKLASLQADRISMFESVEELITRFFRSKGRNLLVAFLSTLIFWFVSSRVYGRILGTDYFSNPDHVSQTRFIHVCYFLVSGFGAFFVFLFVLFLFGDWILLFFGCLLLLGIGWTSKAALPKVWSQLGLLLNVGPVREGERVEYRGLPFLVDRLGFHSHFLNPALADGKVRLPLADLVSLRSRPIAGTEPWFASNAGDWILLEDATLAQVAEQSIDFVALNIKGGGKRICQSREYLSKSFLNLSGGYQLKVQATVLDIGGDMLRQCMDRLQEAAETGLAEHNCSIHLSLVTIKEVSAAGVSLCFYFDCAGSEAPLYYERKGLVQEVVRKSVAAAELSFASDLVRVNVDGVSSL